MPAGQLADPRYVRARGVMAGADRFDAAFFDFAPREAEILDPQQRLFLECAWEALEDAGCDPRRFPGRIGVFAGVGMNHYVMNLAAHPELVQAVGGFQVMLGNDKDYLATRVAYKLDLRGPALTVQTACSTSLVAVAPRLREPAHRRVRHGARRRRDPRPQAGSRLPLGEGRHRLAGRPLPAVRRPRRGHGGGQTAPASWCSSGSPTPSPTATASAP